MDNKDVRKDEVLSFDLVRRVGVVDVAEGMMHFINAKTAFEKCFATDAERERYMYMYSVGDTHYFKHIDSRQYVRVIVFI